MTLTVLGAVTIPVSGATYASYHAMFWINLTSGAPDSRVQGDVWYRQSDLSVLQAIVESNVSASGTAKYTSNVTYAPPLPLHFPLVANDTWLATTTATLVQTSQGQSTTWDNVTFTFAFKVGQPIDYTVAAGTFTTMAINTTVTGPQSQAQTVVYYWSGNVGNSVTGPLIAPGMFELGTGSELVAYHHSAPSGPPANPLLEQMLPVIAGVAMGGIVVAATAAIFLRRGRRKTELGSPGPEPRRGSRP